MRGRPAVALAVATALAAGCGAGATPTTAPPCFVHVYFAPGASRHAVRSLRRRLARGPHVERVRIVWKERVLAAMKRKYPNLPIGARNPFPDALVVRLRRAQDVASMQALLRPRPRGVAVVSVARACG